MDKRRASRTSGPVRAATSSISPTASEPPISPSWTPNQPALNVTDVPSGVTTSTSLSVAPGILQSLVVAPQTSTPVAGAPFSTDLSAFDEYGNVDTNYTGSQCIPSPGQRLLRTPIRRSTRRPGPARADTRSLRRRCGLRNECPERHPVRCRRGVLMPGRPTGVSGFAGLTVSPGGPNTFALARHRPRWPGRPSLSA